MDYEESRQVILTATALRARGQLDQCIELMLANIPQIDPDIQTNAWMEVLGAAEGKGDIELGSV